MDLRTYIFRNKIKGINLAKTVGCSAGHLSAIANGKFIPTEELAKKIEEATNGVITAKSYRLMKAKKLKEEVKKLMESDETKKTLDDSKSV